jgi:hypothetical protein
MKNEHRTEDPQPEGVASNPGEPGAYNGNIPSGRPHGSPQLADQQAADAMQEAGPHTGATSQPYQDSGAHRADQYDDMGDDMGQAARRERI